MNNADFFYYLKTNQCVSTMCVIEGMDGNDANFDIEILANFLEGPVFLMYGIFLSHTSILHQRMSMMF